MSSRSNGSKFFEKVRVGCFHTAARMVPRYILGPPCFGEVPEICGNLTSSNSLFRFGSLRTVAKPVTISNGVMLQLKRCDFAALDCPKKTFVQSRFLVAFLCWKGMQTAYVSYKQVANDEYVHETLGCCASERYVVQKRPAACSCWITA